jgi:transposase
MAKRLTPVQTEEMKKMVVKGVAPEDIANHFGIAISSVHNYKKRFKDEGMSFPSVKGKRPAGQVQNPAGSVKAFKHTEKTISVSAQARNMPSASTLRVIVNGVSVEVSAGAKSVNINKDQIEVKY